MTFTYTAPVNGVWAALPNPSEIRFLLRDRREASWSLTDEEILALRTEWNAAHPDFPDDINGIAALAAGLVADFFESQTLSERKQVGNSSLERNYSNRAAAYRALATRLGGLAATPVAVISGGFGRMGRSPAGDPVFTIGAFDA